MFVGKRAARSHKAARTMPEHSDHPAPPIAALPAPTKRSALALAAPILAVLLFGAPGMARQGAVLTPLILAVENAPVPFRGSDGNTHLVYELFVTNFSSGSAVVEGAEILSGDTVVSQLDAAAVASRLQPAGQRESTGTLAPGMQALLFLHVVLASNAPVPKKLSHRLAARMSAAPPGRQEMRESGGEILVGKSDVVTIGPPLAGARFIAGDSCCDASRHTRAALPVDGRVVIAQRFAVDWEQLDAAGRVYAGAQSAPKNYTIYDKDVLAVSDASVVSVLDDLPDQPPGKMPEGIAIEEADGNSIVLDLGGGRYALYAHLRAGSIRVRPGDRVKLGQVMARVGNSGNTIAPHLHFHVMDAPIPLGANGLPYAIDAFTVTGTTSGTAAFDKAESDGTPLAIAPFTPPRTVMNALPLDQLEITFGR
jgi:hypothetical protein